MKAVLPVAGLGTRMLPYTKEQPKEMLPVFDCAHNGEPLVKPVVQLIFEQLYSVGIREFVFVVGRGKRIIEDHFTPDWKYVEYLYKRGKELYAKELEKFYEMVEGSTIAWVNQPEPKGFGHAVMLAEPFIGGEDFLVHAGDTLVLTGQSPKRGGHLQKLLELHARLCGDATFLSRRVEDPRAYGVVITSDKVMGTVFRVAQVIEKPEQPPSNLAIMPIYVFDSVIFKALRKVKPGKRGEIELTDAIQTLITWGLDVYTMELGEHIWIDVGNPKMYFEALKLTYSVCSTR